MLAFKIYLSLSGIVKLFEFFFTHNFSIVDFRFTKAANLMSKIF